MSRGERLAAGCVFAVLLCLPLAGRAGSAGELPQTAPRAELSLRGPAGAVFQQLGQLYGIRVKVEEEFPRQVIRLSLKEVDFSEALRAAAGLARAFWVVQEDGTVLVAEDTPEKRARFEPMVLKTFVLPGLTAEQLDENVRLLREVLEMRRVQLDARSYTITVRDTPYRVAVAERLLSQLPIDPGEVMVEALLLEVDRERALELGLVSPDPIILVHLGAGALAVQEGDSIVDIIEFLLRQGLLPEAVTQSALGSALGSGALDPSALAGLLPPFAVIGGGGTSFALNLPDFELRMSQLSRVTKSWRRLSLRARAGEEASLFIGERFPIIFGTFSTIFVPAIIQELIRRGQFTPPVPAISFEELGVRLTVTPRIHPGREVSLSLKLDQKALSGQSLNDIPVLASRLVEQQARLRDGESLLVAGLRRDTSERSRIELPGLGSAPVIGPLFGRNSPRTQTTELIILLRPRIVRMPAREYLALRTLYVGTEQDFAPVGKGPIATPAPPRQPAPPGVVPPTGVPPPRQQLRPQPPQQRRPPQP